MNQNLIKINLKIIDFNDFEIKFILGGIKTIHFSKKYFVFVYFRINFVNSFRPPPPNQLKFFNTTMPQFCFPVFPLLPDQKVNNSRTPLSLKINEK